MINAAEDVKLLNNDYEKIAQKIYHLTNKKSPEPLSTTSLNLDDDRSLKLTALLQARLLKLEIKKNKSDFIKCSVVFVVSASTGIITYFIPKSLGWYECNNPGACNPPYYPVEDLCYEEGLNLNCVNYFMEINNNPSIPPYPSYMKDCDQESNVPLNLIGKTIPYLTLDDRCDTKNMFLAFLPICTAFPALGSFCGCVFNGSKYIYNKITSSKLALELQETETTTFLNDLNLNGQPKWFQNVIDNTKEFYNLKLIP